MSEGELEFVRLSRITFGGPYGWFRNDRNRLVLVNFGDRIDELKELVDQLQEEFPDA